MTEAHKATPGPWGETSELVKRLRAEAAIAENGVVLFNGNPDIDLANDTMQCAADRLRDVADAIERLERETRQLRNTLQLHAGDVTSLSLDADREHERAEVAEARIQRLEEALRTFLPETVCCPNGCERPDKSRDHICWDNARILAARAALEEKA